MLKLNFKELQYNVTGFLEKEASAFCKELQRLCVSAQSSPQGVPQELVEEKKAELKREKVGNIVLESSQR